MSPDTFFIILQIWALAMSLAVGSFLNVCIARMPEDRSVISPPSHCPSCGHQIQWFDNIPVLSWVALGARCRNCKTPISALYPAIELLVGLLGLLLFRKLVPDLQAVTTANLVAWAAYLWFISMLVTSTFVDIKHYIIPDQFSIYAIPMGVGTTLALGFLGYEGPLAISWQQSVVGALAGGGVLLLMIGFWWLLRRVEAMGFGDVKLLAMMGAYLGALPAVPVIIVLSAVAGSLVGIPAMLIKGKGMRLQLPFGPFLAAAGILYVFFGEELLSRWFLSMQLTSEVLG